MFPGLVRNISYSANFYLRVGQSSCSCFVSLIFLIFSFHWSLTPCIKTHNKTQEMALKRLYFSKFSWGACPWTPLEVLTPLALVGQIRVRPPPPKFLSPYAYDPDPILSNILPEKNLRFQLFLRFY